MMSFMRNDLDAAGRSGKRQRATGTSTSLWRSGGGTKGEL
jgi:hypothetical protein